jgi:hypothetical protein
MCLLYDSRFHYGSAMLSLSVTILEATLPTSGRLIAISAHLNAASWALNVVVAGKAPI